MNSIFYFIKLFLFFLLSRILKEQNLFIFLTMEDNRTIIAKNEIKLISLSDQLTYKRVYWLKDQKGMPLSGLTLKVLYLVDQVSKKKLNSQ